MKKLLLLTLAIVMSLSLAACGSASATLVDVTTEQGLGLKLPSDMTLQNSQTYANTKTSDVVTFGLLEAVSSNYTDWTEEDFTASELSDYADLVMVSYDNDKQIDGKAALIATYTFTSEGGNALTDKIVMFTDGVTEYVVSFLYLTDNTDGSLAKNIQACIDSITVVAVG